MHQLTVRLSEKMFLDLKAVSIAEGRPMAEIVRKCVEDYTQSIPVEEIKELIAKARSLGPVSKEQAITAADRAVEMDDTPGIGTDKVRISSD